ncbi:hypothetical protein ACRE81_26510, partial [Klebsiella pneumoniae]
MPQPQIMLGGVPIVLHAGAPVLSEEPVGGETSMRMSDGALVSMTHWERVSGTISGNGWMPPGLHGLDYSQPLELRSTKVQSGNSLHDYLQTKLWFDHGCPCALTTQACDSAQSTNVQFADMLSGV